MDFLIGPYTITDSDIRKNIEAGQPFGPLQSDSLVTSIGSFRVSAHLSDSTLEEWRSFIGYSTKHRAVMDELTVNGIPGFTIRVDSNYVRRIDYVFKAADLKCIEFVAWSDVPASTADQEAVHRMAHSLRVSGGTEP